LERLKQKLDEKNRRAEENRQRELDRIVARQEERERKAQIANERKREMNDDGDNTGSKSSLPPVKAPNSKGNSKGSLDKLKPKGV
jgi:hypothetical protein